MCLALPYRIVRLLEPGQALAEGPEGPRRLDTWPTPDLRPGDLVLAAYGAAVRRIDPDEAAEILSLWDEIRSSPAPAPQTKPSP